MFGWQEINVTKAAKSKTFGDILFGIETIANNPIMGSAHGGGQYKHGTSVQISATPNYGYKFVKWNDGSTANPRTVTVTGSHTYIAEFVPCSFGVTLLVNSEGTGTVKGAGEYTYLDNITVEATPSKGYHFDKWTVFRHNEHTTKTVKTASMPIVVDQSYTCKAHFEPNEYTITVITDGTTGGKASIVYKGSTSQSSVVAQYGTSFKLSAPKVAGSEFKGWKIQGENNYFSSSGSVNLDVPAKNITYIAVYKTIPSIKISGGSTNVKTTKLMATTVPPNQSVTWKSSNSSVVSVDSKGNITSKGEGTVTITASFVYDGKTYSDTVKVKGALTKIKLSSYAYRTSGLVRHYYAQPVKNYVSKGYQKSYGEHHHVITVTEEQFNNATRVASGGYAYCPVAVSGAVKQNGYNKSSSTGYILYDGAAVGYYFLYFYNETVGPGGLYISSIN